MRKIASILNNGSLRLLSRWLVVSVLLLLFSLYSRLHFGVVDEFWPLTPRESSFILIVEGLLEPEAPAMYSTDSLPQFTNLYGPIYPLVVSLSGSLHQNDPYLTQRILVGIFILIGSVLIGFIVAFRAGVMCGLWGAILYYVGMVGSPSIAAGPDSLAVLLYIAGIAFALRSSFSIGEIMVVVLLGFLGLLTKPYVVLIIPSVLTYVYLFVSPRRALLAALFTLGITVLGGLFINDLWPAYFHSVFAIHAGYTTRVLGELVRQCLAFGSLFFFPILIFFLNFPYKCFKKFRLSPLRLYFGDASVFQKAIGFDRFMTIVAAAALLSSLGWHGGAFLIYFLHLLLPPLLISVFSSGALLFAGWKCLLLITNALVLLAQIPRNPKTSEFPKFLAMTLESKVLLDPVLEPLSRVAKDAELVDNGQAEYLINFNLERTGPYSELIERYEKIQRMALSDKHYDFIFLSPVHNRRNFIEYTKVMPTLSESYKLVGSIDIPVYFLYFRHRDQFGRGQNKILVFAPRKNDVVTEAVD
ncbi:MAG: hypothetical protein ACPGN3_04985 [Opitutales bacterium]